MTNPSFYNNGAYRVHHYDGVIVHTSNSFDKRILTRQGVSTICQRVQNEAKTHSTVPRKQIISVRNVAFNIVLFPTVCSNEDEGDVLVGSDVCCSGQVRIAERR